MLLVDDAPVASEMLSRRRRLAAADSPLLSALNVESNVARRPRSAAAAMAASSAASDSGSEAVEARRSGASRPRLANSSDDRRPSLRCDGLLPRSAGASEETCAC